MPERSDNSGIRITGGDITGESVAIGGGAAVFSRSEAPAEDPNRRALEDLIAAVMITYPLDRARVFAVLRAVWPAKPPTHRHQLAEVVDRFCLVLMHEFRDQPDWEFALALRNRLAQTFEPERRELGVDVPVSIYVDDESAGPDVERAVVGFLDELGLPVVEADPSFVVPTPAGPTSCASRPTRWWRCGWRPRRRRACTGLRRRGPASRAGAAPS